MLELPAYDPRRWYWAVAEGNRIWSSAAGAWVESVPADAVATPLATEAELDAVLRAARLPSPVFTAADVKVEAQRRIIVRTGATDIISTLTKQMNAQMRATELTRIEIQRALTTEEQAEAAALQSLANDIKHIRARSNAIEALTPIPADYAADSRWT